LTFERPIVTLGLAWLAKEPLQENVARSTSRFDTFYLLQAFEMGSMFGLVSLHHQAMCYLY
jgi:hypothetical protein